jgi:hypothetical protein
MNMNMFIIMIMNRIMNMNMNMNTDTDTVRLLKFQNAGMPDCPRMPACPTSRHSVTEVKKTNDVGIGPVPD